MSYTVCNHQGKFAYMSPKIDGTPLKAGDEITSSVGIHKIWKVFDNGQVLLHKDPLIDELVKDQFEASYIRETYERSPSHRDNTTAVIDLDKWQVHDAGGDFIGWLETSSEPRVDQYIAAGDLAVKIVAIKPGKIQLGLEAIELVEGTFKGSRHHATV